MSVCKLSEAQIHSVRIAAAHDGAAELIVKIVYANGATNEVSLDQMASAHLMQSCGVDDIEQLTGQSWSHVKQALSKSFNRYK